MCDEIKLNSLSELCFLLLIWIVEILLDLQVTMMHLYRSMILK